MEYNAMGLGRRSRKKNKHIDIFVTLSLAISLAKFVTSSTLAHEVARLAVPFVNSSSFYLSSASNTNQQSQHHSGQPQQTKQSSDQTSSCINGLATFEISTGFIYKPATTETLATLPSTLQLTDCLGFCLQNSSCLAINFEMGLCVLLSSSAKHNSTNLYSSQFPVFTIYAEKLCLLTGE